MRAIAGMMGVMGQKKFKTEVSRLLHLITHSLYSNREVFMRELISNASDAIDKRKFQALTDAAAAESGSDTIEVRCDEKERMWISVSDNGIGMNERELEEFLGTIANSGTSAFLKSMGSDEQKSSELIGQFGVGFYSSFIVGKRVVVTSRRYDEQRGWQWISDGIGSYTIAEYDKADVGTEVRIELTDEGKEFANRYRLNEIIKRYSDHVSHPIFLHYSHQEYDDTGKPKGEAKMEREQVNAASAMWRRQKSELTDKDYAGFYNSISLDNEPPLAHVHVQAEGVMNYTALLFIPQKAPADIFFSDYQSGMRLYIQRVFITDEHKKLMPIYLRFLRGIIDSEDLPLNVSREILQDNQLLTKIRTAVVKRLFSMLNDMATKEPQRYANFIAQYNALLKEGLYQDFANREPLLKLIRFHSTESQEMISLADYKSRAHSGQKFIYYLTGSDISSVRQSQLLERFRAKKVEVLLLTDEIDEIVVPTLEPYEELSFKAINQSTDGSMDSLIDERNSDLEGKYAPLLKRIKSELGSAVDEVRFSTRLDASPACVVMKGNAPSARLRELLRGHGQDASIPKPILELNPKHHFVEVLAETKESDLFVDMSWLLLEQSLLMANVPFENAHGFVERVNRLAARGLNATPNSAPPKKDATPNSAPPKKDAPSQDHRRTAAQPKKDTPPSSA